MQKTFTLEKGLHEAVIYLFVAGLGVFLEAPGSVELGLQGLLCLRMWDPSSLTRVEPVSPTWEGEF